MKRIYTLATAILLFTLCTIAQPTRTWGTYYGGTTGTLEEARSVAVDKNGNVYVAGVSNATNSIATAGSHQSSYGGGTYDAYLVKFNSAGVRQWATYYGGTGIEFAYGVVVDTIGNVYLAGYSASTSSISTAGSHQAVYGGGSRDAFIVKFNSSGVRQWGTYYGGADADYGFGLAIDDLGNLYLAGRTTSTVAISTPGSHQPIYGGSTRDGFLVKLNNSGVRQWSTYYGGSATDEVSSVAVNEAGTIISIVGMTQSTTAISTLGSHQPIKSTTTDAFVAHFNSSGVRQWGTYYGGVGLDYLESTAIDISGNVYVTGYTQATDSIATVGSHQPVHGDTGSTYDAMVVKFNSSGVRQWGTYYGGTGTDYGRGMAIDANGDITISGYTSSATNIATSGSHQSSLSGINLDAFLARFNGSGVRQWGTYYGGTEIEIGFAVAQSTDGNIYLTGQARSSSGISTVGSHDQFLGGTNDSYLVQFIGCVVAPSQPSSITGNTNICSGSSNTYSIVNDPTATSYTWVLPGGWTGTSTTNSINTTASATSGNITVTANNACGSSTVQTFAVTVNNVPAIPSTITGNASFCINLTAQTYSVTNDPTATSYTWVLPGGWSGTSTTNTINATAGATGGTITVTANNGCGSSTVQTLSVTVNTLPTVVATGTATICNGESTTLSATGANTYSWDNGGGTGSTVSVSPTTTTTYTVTGTDVNTCVNTDQVTITVTPLPDVTVTPATNLLTANNINVGVTYQWLDCNNNYTIITGETAQSYAMTVTGDYAVEVTENGCVDTSACNNVIFVGVNENDFSNYFTIYPNPSNGKFTLESLSKQEVSVKITDITGRMITNFTSNESLIGIILDSESKGIYFLNIKTKEGIFTRKIIIE